MWLWWLGILCDGHPFTSDLGIILVTSPEFSRKMVDRVLLGERDHLADVSTGLKADKSGTVLATIDRVCGRKEQK